MHLTGLKPSAGVVIRYYSTPSGLGGGGGVGFVWVAKGKPRHYLADGRNVLADGCD